MTGLRARLFAMLPANDGRARLAEQCLIAIEEHRDDRGRVSNEPRHPDISTGRAWPPEADGSFAPSQEHPIRETMLVLASRLRLFVL